jgi:phospholipase C
MHAAQSYGLVDNDLPPQTEHTTGFPFETTIWHALEQAGVDHRYYYVDVPVSALWGEPGLQIASPVEEYYARCATGTLPNVSFVDPYFAGSVGEGPGASGDEHPHGDVRMGQAYMADVVHAFMESPQYERGALFVVYDEWGGFYDHVVPKRVPDIRNDKDVAKDYGLMGFRIPALVASPYARTGHVSHSTFGFESILKLIRYRFGLKPLTRRDAYATNIGYALDFQGKPRLERPTLPTPDHVVSQPCAIGGSAEARASEHDLVDMVTSGYLDSLGFDYRPMTTSRAFRSPSRLEQAFLPAS